MPLKDDFSGSLKLGNHLRQIIQTDKGANPDTLFDVCVTADSSKPLNIKGVELAHISDNIHIAHNVPLNGLKALIDDPRVRRIDGGRALFPKQSQKEKTFKP